MNDESKSKTYRALQATGEGKLELVQLPIPLPRAGEVRIKVEACGVCHTDVVTLQNTFPGLKLPRVPGHEVVGRVDALGQGVSDWKIGQRVGVGFLGGRCGHCKSCRSGDFVNCENQLLTGIHRDGGYAEMMIANHNGLVAIPPELSSVEAAPLLCAGVTTFNALRRSTARAGDLVAIQGVGGLGHLAIQYARRMGFHTVAVARGAEKADLSKALGAHAYIDSDAEDPAAALQALGGAHVILSTVSNPTAMAQMLGGLGRRGQLMVVGAGPEPMPVSTFGLLFGERSIAGSNTGSPSNIEGSLQFSVLQDIRAKVETVPLEDAARAYDRMMKNEARFRMVLTTGA